ncbi:rod shape-determining protein [Sphingobium baderi]|uniref:rod shape-determining protein n=1 Tax=Sphingobium baderi TaxID=1332080 RepID=UPI002B409BAF|nr:rod shape-determining protein [Sphingobium baderi]WRD77439.1 rod shape-determining protein [Sphingobium baderi]
MANMISWNGRRADIAIDLGTANTRVAARGSGMVFDEPSLCCFSNGGTRPRLVAAGEAVRAMVDRTPDSLKVTRPLRRGVLQDIDATRELLAYAMSSSLGRRRLRAPRVAIGIPADATQAERSALLTAASDAGLGPVSLMSEPFAAALGAGLAVHRPEGSMIVECGAGTTEVAVISLGGICLTRSVRIGGAALDTALADHFHFRRKFLIGEITTERLKCDLVRLLGAPDGEESQMIEAKGRSLTSGIPGVQQVPVSELRPVVAKHVAHIVEVVRDVLNQTPPELSHDIHEKGLTLTGGSAAIPRIGQAITAETGLRVHIPDHPHQCVMLGLEAMLAS